MSTNYHKLIDEVNAAYNKADQTVLLKLLASKPVHTVIKVLYLSTLDMPRPQYTSRTVLLPAVVPEVREHIAMRFRPHAADKDECMKYAIESWRTLQKGKIALKKTMTDYEEKKNELKKQMKIDAAKVSVALFYALKDVDEVMAWAKNAGICVSHERVLDNQALLSKLSATPSDELKATCLMRLFAVLLKAEFKS